MLKLVKMSFSECRHTEMLEVVDGIAPCLTKKNHHFPCRREEVLLPGERWDGYAIRVDLPLHESENMSPNSDFNFDFRRRWPLPTSLLLYSKPARNQRRIWINREHYFIMETSIIANLKKIRSNEGIFVRIQMVLTNSDEGNGWGDAVEGQLISLTYLECYLSQWTNSQHIDTLKVPEDGAFLIRYSGTDQAVFVISVRWAIQCSIINNKSKSSQIGRWILALSIEAERSNLRRESDSLRDTQSDRRVLLKQRLRKRNQSQIPG